MKNLKAKILAGVLSTAMVIGTLAGAGPLVAKAAASYETELTVRAVDESGLCPIHRPSFFKKYFEGKSNG